MLYNFLMLLPILSISILQPAMAHEPLNYQSAQNNQYSNQSNEVSITNDGTYRYITSNGIPYSHGQFPNANNPNTVGAQNYKFKMPLNPQLAGRNTELWGGMDFGVALDGVPFDPGTAELWHNDQNWRYEAMSGKINLGIDFNNAHVQPNGAYHYHALPIEVTKSLNSSTHSTIVGYAADGFPIYALYGYSDPKNSNSAIKELQSSYRLKAGTRPSGPGGNYDGTFTQDYEYVEGIGDLDECNGRITITPDYPQGIYAYFITDTFPLIPRCFKGTPDNSFVKQGGGPSGMGQQSNQQVPRQGIRLQGNGNVNNNMQRRPPPPPRY